MKVARGGKLEGKGAGDLTLPMMAKLACGGVAGLFAQTITYPLDVVRRRMQIAPLDGSQAWSRTMWGTARHVMATQGVRGLYKGVTINWAKGPVAIGLSFTIYEMLKESFAREQRGGASSA